MARLTPKEFAAECRRRLMDTHDMTVHFGLRSRDSVRKRVAAGTLPEPIISDKPNGLLWDRDSLPPTERKRRDA